MNFSIFEAEDVFSLSSELHLKARALSALDGEASALLLLATAENAGRVVRYLEGCRQYKRLTLAAFTFPSPLTSARLAALAFPSPLTSARLAALAAEDSREDLIRKALDPEAFNLPQGGEYTIQISLDRRQGGEDGFEVVFHSRLSGVTFDLANVQIPNKGATARVFGDVLDESLDVLDTANSRAFEIISRAAAGVQRDAEDPAARLRVRVTTEERKNAGVFEIRAQLLSTFDPYGAEVGSVVVSKEIFELADSGAVRGLLRRAESLCEVLRSGDSIRAAWL